MKTTKEIWKDIPGFEKQYQASSLGRIRSVDRQLFVNNAWGSKSIKNYAGKLLNFRNKINGAGYYTVSLGTYCHRDVHRLIAETFLKTPSKKHQVNHKNCNKLDNRVSNLEWLLPSENIQHMILNGRLNKHKKNMSFKISGEKNPKAKLTKDSVKRIKKSVLNGFPRRLVANMFGISYPTVTNIVNNKTWRNINV